MSAASTVRVKDFGPIAEASVDLKPLTIFMGPNNSGKSYLALAVYCLFRTLAGEPITGGGSARTRPILSGTLDSLEQARADIIRTWPDARSVPDEPIKVGEMPSGLQMALLEANNSLGNAFAIQFQTELERCYGTEMGGLAKRSSSLTGPSFEIEFSQPDKAFSCEMVAAHDRMVVKSWENNLLERAVQIGPMFLPYRDLIDDVGRSVMFIMLDLETGSQRPGRMTHYIPASRSGLLLVHKTLIGNIVDSVSRSWVEPFATPKLTGVETDFIRALQMSAPGKSPNANLQGVISFLENDIAHGSLYMDQTLEPPEVRYENDIDSFSIHQVSSMVSEIAPIVLYLRHHVREGHLFIIEEPESHLDAANQMKLARAIAMLVNAGVYVLITTHSDFFVKQLDNLLLVSQLTPRRRAARKYSATEVLQPSDVGAYMFEPGPEGSIVRTLEVTADGGIPTEPFSDAHTDLYDEAIALEHTAR